MPASDADREADVTTLVRALGLPVPQAFGRVDVDGRPGVIFQRVEGRPLLDLVLQDPVHAMEAARTLAQLHAAVHEVIAPTLPRLRDRLGHRINEATALPPARREAALNMLHDLPDGGRLCHGDFHPANVLLTESGPVIIDWLDATSGQPLADVARILLLIRFAGLPDSPELRPLTTSLRDQFAAAYLAGYRGIQPAPEETLNQWLVVAAAARLADGIAAEHDTLLSLLATAFGPASA
jgi:thiamine kinase